MKKYHIPHDLISMDGENELHEKVNKDIKFSRYHRDMLRLLDENIMDEKLKGRISEACQLVYIFAEIAAYREGFHEGIKFLINTLANTDSPSKIRKRDKDFNTAFDKFISEYKLDRIADVHDFLEEDEVYRKLHADKSESERALQASTSDTMVTDALLNYMTSVDHLINEVKSIFYEHGFQDSIAITKAMQRCL